MSVFRRHKKESGYTNIDNHVFNDKTLSMKAKGLLTQIYSLPDNWEYSVRGLSTLFKDSKDAVNNALQELIDHGYIVRTQRINNFGRFEGYDYDIYERPQNVNVSVNPITEKPLTENPITDNPTQLNTNLLNTNIVNTKDIDNPPISPLENRKMLFAQFWEAYPKCKRKVDKDGCEKAFVKIKNLEVIFPEIMASLEIWKRDWAKDNNEYVPIPHKWITKKYYEVKDTRTEIEAKIDEIAKQNMNDFLFN